MNLMPVIMSGGAGSRLWPLSRELFPKPFLAVPGGGTLEPDPAVRRSLRIDDGRS